MPTPTPDSFLIHVMSKGDFEPGRFVITDEEMEETNRRIAKSSEITRRILTDSMAATEYMWSD